VGVASENPGKVGTEKLRGTAFIVFQYEEKNIKTAPDIQGVNHGGGLRFGRTDGKTSS